MNLQDVPKPTCPLCGAAIDHIKTRLLHYPDGMGRVKVEWQHECTQDANEPCKVFTVTATYWVTSQAQAAWPEDAIEHVEENAE